jgi:hypothetical protein
MREYEPKRDCEFVLMMLDRQDEQKWNAAIAAK